jgi:aryl-phospho-beta-D-glucosidase BglC (GH1 family)
MNRRSFVKNAGLLVVAGASATGAAWCAGSPPPKNKLPKWKGFNLLDFFIPDPVPFQHATTEEHIKWMHDWGFDFIRLPVSYPTYLKFDRSRNITPEEVYQIDEQRVNAIDTIIHWAHKYNMHVSLNLHRAPGYCINTAFNEPFNLWKDEAAQKAFYFHWGMWAKRYKDVSSKKISFDLLNEPAFRNEVNDPHATLSAVPGELYRKIATGAMEVIHKENPHYLIIADGNSGGSDPVPELAGLPIHQSCRGYYPFSISHYKAAWANPDPEHMPMPQWPGKTGHDETNRRLLEKYYQPWSALLAKGVGVHCGECGSFNKTPHRVFLAWFNDVLEILSKNNIGFALWNFIGDFGVLDSNRTDVAYENWQGHKLDRKLLKLLQKY